MPTAHGVPVCIPLPLPTAQNVLTSFKLSSLSPTAQHEFVSSHLIACRHNATLHVPALHDVGKVVLMTQAPPVTHHGRACWRFGPLQKFSPKPLASLLPLFRNLRWFCLPLCDLLHHFVALMHHYIFSIACICSVGHLPPGHAAMLLQHDLCRSLCSKHYFVVLTSRLLSKLSFLRQKTLWLLNTDMYGVPAQTEGRTRTRKTEKCTEGEWCGLNVCVVPSLNK